jgi:hypothetical protein
VQAVVMRVRAAAVGLSAWTVLSGALILGRSAEVSACGYHDDVSRARGVLNWVYPDALHVVGAIASAVSERRLPPPTSLERDPWAYQRIVRLLDQYGGQLRSVSGEAEPPPFSLLLIEPMLWTRFVPDSGKLRARAHVPGPETGDLVLISGEDVIREIVANRLTIAEAHQLGLLRLYGARAQVEFFVERYSELGRATPRQ